jgi:hypothetical protein
MTYPKLQKFLMNFSLRSQLNPQLYKDLPGRSFANCTKWTGITQKIVFSSLLQTWFDQGKIAGQSEDKPLKIDTEPFAEVNMVVEVNWPRKKQ